MRIKTVCSACRRRVLRSKDGKKLLDPKTGQPHRCKNDVYDLPEHERLHIFIPKTDRFKK